MIMETYQRRRFRKSKETGSEMEQRNSCKNGVHGNPPAVLFPTSDRSPKFQLNSTDGNSEIPFGVYQFNKNQVEVGSVYEIDHLHLPPRTPIQLRTIRVAMVSEKTELNVAVRYPSMDSLQTYFSNIIEEMYPALDEKFVMGTALAAKVLRRRVPSQQFAESKHLKSFWLVNAATVDASESDDSYKKGNLLTELKSSAVVRWGIRRQVKFLERHKEKINDNVQSSSSLYSKESMKTKAEDVENTEETDGDDEDEEDEVDHEQEDDEDNDEREDDDEEVPDDSDEEGQETDRNLKRKRYRLRNSTRENTKKVKVAKKKQQQKKKTIKKKSRGRTSKNRCRELMVIENPKDRWSAERYKLATQNLLAVMKAKRATASHPILRPDLREEARKKIGDTGLLDHLLKHMAGKLAPGGEERFRRRHNADGAMEYWLESADLVSIRKEAGVSDPFWVPPPGWQPGDNPTQDPVCARELKLLREEIAKLKRNMKDMVPRKLLEQEIEKLRREIGKTKSSKQQEESLAIELYSNPSDLSQKLKELAYSLEAAKPDIAKAPGSLEKYNEQLLVIQDVVMGIEDEIKKLLPQDDHKGKEKSKMALMAVDKKEKQQKQVELDYGREEEEMVDIVSVGQAEETAAAKAKRAAAMAEEKAAKIERLKSGFRICKPQGTFLWPSSMARNNTVTTTTTTTTTTNDVVASPQVVVQFEDSFVVPTPPSVSSSTALAPPQLPYHHPNTAAAASLRPPSPVKPLAERRAVTVTVSTLSTEKGDNNYSTTTTTTTSTKNKFDPSSYINLNDVPSNPAVGFSGNLLPIVIPPVVTDEVHKRRSRSFEVLCGDVGSATSGAVKTPDNFVPKKLCKSLSTASCLSTAKDMGTWLALAPASSASEDSS
ncbi:OLC1v1027147C1 [Oldenlandia corymbosa var. corymbosa]|uniref:OLC1v1027147C1 n=1 Tax=Oldenlandia corymbosa var. corymbosa TaxID=529605 RepID=A0AAV1C9I3_OLDCO|nr:OLC1v1027147C1 [Oldenlandia corymbosa var. corymbosa]